MVKNESKGDGKWLSVMFVVKIVKEVQQVTEICVKNVIASTYKVKIKSNPLFIKGNFLSIDIPNLTKY
jgi:hypothetical protein